jgi:LCP family protein required for cell wall assembly
VEEGWADNAPDADADADGAPAILPPEAIRSRADLQKELRKSHKKDHKRQHRWRRRVLYALALVVLLAALGAGGVYEYANYRYGQIRKIHAKHLVAQPSAPGKPFNMLLVGSDSRAFVGDNSTLSSEVGNEADAGGQRSDVTMVARFDPAAKTITVMSIPRDLWVNIPGDVSGISGMNRINAAYNSGPDLLVQTIEQDLGIPINHYASVDFPGFSGMVNALGGITLDFPTPVKDAYTGLRVTTTGCQVVNGTVALQLVRSRHLYYMDSEGYWEYDGLSDFSRIQRQDKFFRAVLQKVNQSITNPLTINAFIGASVGNITIDDTLTESDLFHIAEVFKGLPSSNLVTETLPTTSFVTDGGADVLQEAQPYAQNMIKAFNAIGTTPPTTTTTTTTTTSPPKHGKHPATTTTTAGVPHNQVTVNVLNASTVNDIAHFTAVALSVQGFYIGNIGDASTPLPAGGSSEILYGPDGYAAALAVGKVLNGPVTYMADPDLRGQTVSLLIAGSGLTVKSSSSTPTSTTLPSSGPTTTTTTTIPSDVYANTQPEPWNPYPCTLSSPTTTTTANVKTAAAKAKTKAKAKASTTTTTTHSGSRPARPPSTSTTVTAVPHDQVDVNVFNASTVNGIAHSTAVALSVQGFYINDIANASTQLSPGDSSEILYGPVGYAAALALGMTLNGPVSYVSDPDLSGQTVSLLIAGSSLTVKSPPQTTTSTAPPKAK